ncbi:riboflavin biosynthesis protein RibF [Rubellicoccus peritrichatus]|uniref:Riboflavin biosynthesis protein n=1 Tax=Rubellicoccus peritrichatus TaxID=3080537 RepID=A0AAQ3QTJ6_9BACT|nr:riboflavin biosynthesis protein RibF [Puniceicoccus sp. CR14]WOO39468.1 riboflavin biosynthesis protein RibF [Puniceicoccus sp. CR14]
MLKIPATVDSLLEADLPKRPVHLAIGVFDGVHLGHQAVIEAAIQSAKRSDGISAVLTFDPHPSHLFRPNDPTRLLMPKSAKEGFLHKLGVDLVIFQTFDANFASIEAEDFPGYLQKCLPTLCAVYVGENFRFGKARRGDVDLLIQASRECGIDVISVQRIRENGEPISSTRIREELSSGKIERVNALLGHRYSSSGKIQAGRKLGRTIGFPTVNLPWQPELAPCYGVYCVKARLKGKDSANWHTGVANYGVRPTVERGDSVMPLLEVHLLDEVSWQPDDEITVIWEKFIRSEQKFAGIDDLKTQISKDRQFAQDFFT